MASERSATSSSARDQMEEQEKIYIRPLFAEEKKAYVKPVVIQEKKLNFAEELFQMMNEGISCQQCSSCHGCR